MKKITSILLIMILFASYNINAIAANSNVNVDEKKYMY